MGVFPKHVLEELSLENGLKNWMLKMRMSVYGCLFLIIGSWLAEEVMIYGLELRARRERKPSVPGGVKLPA